MIRKVFVDIYRQVHTHLLTVNKTKRLRSGLAMKVDPAILAALPPDTDPTQTSMSTHGGSGFSSTAKITAKTKDGSEERYYFVKTGKGKDAEVMFRGEHESLNALKGVVEGICPGMLYCLI